MNIYQYPTFRGTIPGSETGDIDRTDPRHVALCNLCREAYLKDMQLTVHLQPIGPGPMCDLTVRNDDDTVFGTGNGPAFDWNGTDPMTSALNVLNSARYQLSVTKYTVGECGERRYAREVRGAVV